MAKFCIDCKHCKPLYDQRHQCHHEVTAINDMVTGFRTFRTCEYARVVSDLCGREGKLWEAREPLAVMCYNKFVQFFKPKRVKT